ncbi:hypothetical protein EVJ58_g7708 [Rhodofomes roseus]|uniref:Vps41 beta-propeller domain-containing protein n=1 Tax=Rhodofomes roseus TaxID=34475 RepID=A0A4Y9Y241_9APHY|nr:hypothetical protein EVJ58_g7708 [Rhodofomes roseus]
MSADSTGNGLDDEKQLLADSPEDMSDPGDDDRSTTSAHSVKHDARPDGNGHSIAGLHHHDTHSDEDQAGTDGDGDETGSEDGDEDSDEDEEDEDEEPALKYERLGGITHQLLQKDSASAIAYANQRIALGTHGGMLHILSLTGELIKSFQPHSASVTDISVDLTGEWVATASLDGQVVLHSVSSPESHTFDMKRSLRTVALEPNFAKSSTRSLVCGGMAGSLVLHEKGWLGYKETVLHTGEGPVWQGVKIYDTVSQTRITYIDRPPDSPRADLFKCTLHCSLKQSKILRHDVAMQWLRIWGFVDFSLVL